MGDMDLARTMIITVAVLFEMLLVFNCKTDKFIFKSSFNKYIVYAVLVSMGLHLIVLYTPLNALFGFVHLGLNEWVQIIGAGLIGFFAVELYKFVMKKKKK